MTDTLEHRGLTMPQRETPCLTRLTAHLPWQPIMALRVGQHLVGVRADTTHTANAIADLFAAERAPELDHAVRPNFSIEMPVGRRRHLPSALGLVYRDHEVVARRRTAGELLADLVELVEATARPFCSSHIAVRASALQGPDGQVMLLPPSWFRSLIRHSRALQAKGLIVLASDIHLVDPDSGEVTVAPVTSVGLPIESRGRVFTWGVRVHAGAPQELRPAEGLLHVFPSVVNRDRLGAGHTLHSLARMSTTMRLVGLPACTGTATVTTAISLTG